MNLKSTESLSSLLSGTSQLHTQPSPSFPEDQRSLPRRGSLACLYHLWSPRPVPTLVHCPRLIAYNLASNLLSLLDFFGIFKHLIPCDFICLGLFFLYALTGIYPAGISFSYFLALFIISLGPFLLFVFLLPNWVIRMPQISSPMFEILFAHLCVGLASMRAWICMFWCSILRNKPLILLRCCLQPIWFLNSSLCVCILPIIGYNEISLSQNQVRLTSDVIMMDMLVD